MELRLSGGANTPAFFKLMIVGAVLVASVPGLCREGLDGETEYAFVLTTDYWSAAYYSTIEIASPRKTEVSIEPVSTDAVAYYDYDEGMVFVVNRYLADNIQIVDPDSSFATVGQYSVGNGSNPHEIRLVDSTKAYVSRFEWKTLLICHPYTGDSLGVIDLSPFADADGIPEMDRMEIVGDRLFVTLNSIDHTTWQPDGPGKVAVIDVVADTLVDCDPGSPGVQPIVLDLADPYTELRYDPCADALYVGCLGSWGIEDGGIEAIDPYDLVSRGPLMTEGDLGGDVSDVVLASGGTGYAVVLDAVAWPDNFARLVRFDCSAKTVTDTLCIQTSGMGSSMAGIELNRQMELYLCDRDATQPGVRVYDVTTGTEVDFIEVGLPPYDICFTQKAFASVDLEPEEEDAIPAAAAAHPNPFTSSTTITYELGCKGPARIRLDIFDATGRWIRDLAAEEAYPGTYHVEWSGRDDSNMPVAPGVYFCRRHGPGRTAGGKILFIR
jgi:hypothetical protein